MGLRLALVAVGLGLSVWATHARAQDWRSDEALWRAAVTTTPEQPRPALNLAKALGRLGRLPEDAQWTARAAALVVADPVRHGWIRPSLCLHIARLAVLMPEPPTFPVTCEEPE